MRLMGLNPGVIAVAAFCVTSPAYATDIATGPNPNADGYLRIGADEYGSWTSVFFGGTGDTYNPLGAMFGPDEATFTNGFMIFIGGGKELLSDTPDWQGVNCAGGLIGDNTSLTRAVTGANMALDTTGDGVNDTLTSSFEVLRVPVIDLQVGLEQKVESVPGNSIALMTQHYTFENLGANPVSFNLVRLGDFDLIYIGAFDDDSVGTDRAVTNNAVYQQEDSTPATRITMVSVSATDYTGGINLIVPSGGPPAYGFGTDCQTWDNPGLPATWADEIAAVGNKTNGESGAMPADCVDLGGPCDAHIELNIPVVALAPADSITITIRQLYGGTCQWDCEPLPDGVVGITDFLKLLADWGGASACDFDGGGVDVVDFLKLLANWGACM